MPPNDQREIVVDGVRFIHAGDAAAQYGFHADYIARLARQGKITGQRIGKRWYIEQDSICDYLRTLGSHPLPASVSPDKPVTGASKNTTHTLATAMCERGVHTMCEWNYLAPPIPAPRVRFSIAHRATLVATLSVFALVALAATPFASSTFTNAPQQFAAAGNSVFDTFASIMYRAVCPLISDCEVQRVPVNVTTASQANHAGVVSTQAPLAGTTTQTVVYQTVTNPVVERVVERVVSNIPLSRADGIAETALNQRLSELSDKFTRLVYGGSAPAPTPLYISSPPASGGVFNQIAISQKIDQLSSVSVSDSSWSNGSINGASIAASGLSASDFASFATTSVGGSLTVTAGTESTNPFVVNNNLGTTVFAIANDGTLTTNVASTTSSYSSLLVTGNATATNLVVLGTASSSNIFATNATTTHATSTTLYASLGRFASGFFDSFSAILATITNLTTTNLVATNSTTTAATTTTFAVFTAPVAPSFIATSTTASILPFASTTGITVSGTASTTNLVVSGTATLGIPLAQNSGGTGFSTYTAGDILYADNIGNLTKLPAGSAGQVLKVQAGLPAWGTDNTGGGGGGSGYNMWATTTLNLIYPVDTAYPVAIGSNATATLNSIFEVSGQQYISSKLGIATTSPVAPLSVGGAAYVTGGLGVGVYNTSAGTLQTSGNATIGGNLTAQQATSTTLAITGITNALHLANGTGGVVAYTGTSCTNQFVRSVNGAGVATCASVNLGTDVTGTLGIANGGTGTSTSALLGHVLSWNGTNWQGTATSSLGLLTTDVAEGTNKYYSDTLVNAYLHASTTLPKTYTANTFTGANIFNGTLTLGTLNGPLQANAGAISATTSIGVLYGGTGLTSAPAYGQLLVGNSSGGYTLTATSSLGITSGSGTVGSGTTGQFPYYAANGTTLTATSSLFLATSGNIGIGTVSPTVKLEVAPYGTDGDVTALRLYNNKQSSANTKVSLQFYADNDQVLLTAGRDGLGTSGNFNILTRKNGTQTSSLYINETGNIGIGTTTPEAGLSIQGASSYGLLHLNSSSANGEAGISFKSSDDSNAGSGQWIVGKNLGLAGDQFSIWNQNINRLVIDTTGNVGIGTTTPFRLLSMTSAVSTAQAAIAYDTANNTDILTSSVGDLFLYPSGNDALFNNSNFWVCTGGSGATNGCPSGTPTGFGNLIVETAVGVGSSTPFAALSLGANMSIVTTEKSLTDGATIAIDWKNGNQQVVTLGGNRAITFSNYISGATLRLVICQDGTGSRTITSWPAAVLWSSGTAPTLTTTVNKCDVLTFLTTSATGTVRVLGSSVLNF